MNDSTRTTHLPANDSTHTYPLINKYYSAFSTTAPTSAKESASESERCRPIGWRGRGGGSEHEWERAEWAEQSLKQEQW
jgi:hypothetical protein